VSDRRTHNGQAEGHIHACRAPLTGGFIILESEKLYGDESLVVVHDDHRVELPSLHLGKHGVRRKRPSTRIPFALRKSRPVRFPRHPRSEQAALAAMGLRPATARRGALRKAFPRLVRQLDDLEHRSLRTASQALRRDTCEDRSTTLKPLSASIMA